jgi:hypothetical protein
MNLRALAVASAVAIVAAIVGVLLSRVLPAGIVSPSTEGSLAPSLAAEASSSATAIAEPTLAEGEAVDYEEALAYMRELTGSDCASTANATLVLTDAVIGDAEAVPSGSNQWVRSGIWHGSSDALINELGGSVIADHDSYVWLLLNAEGGPYAQLLQRAVTPGGEELWFVAGTVNSLHETECH